MRRSISLTEPGLALAGQVRTWKFAYTTATSLPKGTKLKFDLVLQQKPTDWQVPSARFSTKSNVIWMELTTGETIQAEEILSSLHIIPSFEFTLPVEVKTGDSIEIFMGTPEKGQEAQEKMGNRAQLISQRRRSFHLYIDPKGKGDYKDPEVFNLDVRGNLLHNIRLIVPSMVSKNRRFDILVRFEDLYGNLTNHAPEGTLIELSYEHLRENLNWKLFVPETGFIVLPNLYFNEPGVYRILLKSSFGKKDFFSDPIKCFADNDHSLYWGLLHGESEKIDAAERVETFMRHMRDEVGMQFIATSCFEDLRETSNDDWKNISTQVAEYNEEGRFTSILGLQWFGDENEGLRQLLYWKDAKPLMRKKDPKYSNLKKIYKVHSPKEVLSIPSFTMAKGFETNFEDFNPDFEKVVEIYNAWGSSECLEKEGNPRPIRGKIGETAVGSIRAALNQNFRFGFVAGGLDDRGIYEELFESSQVQYSPGLTAIISIEQTRDTLLQALCNRSCYATTGAKMVLGFYLAHSPMGSELKTKAKPGLAFNRHLAGFICGTAPIKEVLIIRNGEPFYKSNPSELPVVKQLPGQRSQERIVEFTHDDFTPIADIALNSPDDRCPFIYYYMRVLQEDGHIGWTSPIWVDYDESVSFQSPPGAKKPKKKSP